MSNYNRAYCYVDAKWDKEPWYPSSEQDTVKGRWERMRRQEVYERVCKPAKNKNCFKTVQNFCNPQQPSKDKGIQHESHYCGIFFDFDTETGTDGNVSKDAFKQVVHDVRDVITFFSELGIEEPLIRLWFSGGRGFHILVDPRAFGITPHKYVTYIVKSLALYIKEKYNLPTLDDRVYTYRRMWRIPNTIHHVTGLYKTELFHSELTDDYDKLCVLAQKPREATLYESYEYENIAAQEDAAALWKRFVTQFEYQEEVKSLAPKKKIVKTSRWPGCVNDILSNGIKEPGTRNKATVILSCYMKDTGKSQQEALDILLKWVHKLPCDNERKLRERVANTHAVVKHVYADKRYRFSCGAIRSLGTSESPVYCGMTKEGKCATIENNQENQEPKVFPRVPLSRASNSIYVNKVVEIPVSVTGAGESPYVYPVRGKFICTPNLAVTACQDCDIANGAIEREGITEFEFSKINKTLIDVVNCTTARKNSVIKACYGINQRCKKVKIHVSKYENIHELKLQPNIQSGIVDFRMIEGAKSKEPLDDGEFCTGLGYYIGPEIKVNRKYNIFATVMGHPSNQKVCYLFSQADPSQDDIDKFELDEEMFEVLKTFQPAPGQTVADKFNDIHEDLESNVHMIWGRRDVAMAVDLVYHSVIAFWFQERFVKKGWMELLIIGDSGNGKTKLVEEIMRHYQLGEITGVEGGRRTGLIWANHQTGHGFILAWGKLPQNDRRLIVLDEFSGMPDDEVATMTRLRTEGIAESQGINPAQTNARVRMIFLSNPRNGKPLSHYNYGIEAINALFKEHQDVRRLDLAVCVKSGDVSLDLINKKHTPDPSTHAYTSGLCKDLVLWAWSRKSNQVHILPESERMILDYATKLGKKYLCDIVLVEPSDQRLKLARMACATAVRMFSTDETGEKVIVKPEHVDFSYDLINRLYNAPAMEYGVYANIMQKKMRLSDKDKNRLECEFAALPDHEHLVNLFLSDNYFRKRELQDLTGYEQAEVNKLLLMLSKYNLLVPTPRGYKKTPIFTKWLKEMRDGFNAKPPF